MAQISKFCDCCGREFFKRPRDSKAQWNVRIYCSMSCRNKSSEITPLHIRFWEYVDVGIGCWEWTGSKDGQGYGTISYAPINSPYKAHRLAYELRNGAIDKGIVIMHKCDNPGCVNPDHLQAGTQKENVRDMVRKDRQNPLSQLNLKPGHKGFLGAGPLSNKEIQNG